MIIIKGGVTAPNGFLANGVKAGIKNSGKRDLALLYSEVPAVAAAAFTTNRFQASPVRISRLHIKNKSHQAIIVNSGNANCANGRSGDRDALAMADFVAKTMMLDRNEVLVASTGIIGKRMPMISVSGSIPDLIGGLTRERGAYFAESIMTTDTKKKELAIKIRLGRAVVTIGAAAKGVGMIHPEMKTERHATMLSFITSDVSISKDMLERALEEAVEGSFNMVSVDGDMSTNDSCFILANGLAGNRRITKWGKDYGIFLKALKFLTVQLARMLAEDGEGATKLVEIEVVNAGSLNDAKGMARKISTSNLLKCCIFGEDPNWGRVAAAAGASGIDFDSDRTDIYLGDIKVLSNGSVARYNKENVRAIFKKKDIHIKVDLKAGAFSATAWTCDMTKKYVEINAEYST